jgi:hypothetical protein
MIDWSQKNPGNRLHTTFSLRPIEVTSSSARRAKPPTQRTDELLSFAEGLEVDDRPEHAAGFEAQDRAGGDGGFRRL